MDDIDIEIWMDTHCVECGLPDELCLCGLLLNSQFEDDGEAQHSMHSDQKRADPQPEVLSTPAVFGR